MSLFLMANTISLQPHVLMGVIFNVQDVEDSYRLWASEYDAQYTDVLWPRSQGLDGYAYSYSSVTPPDSQWFNWPTSDSGSRSCLLISGASRDLNGNLLAGCQITAYTTADNVVQGGPVTSANDGAFSVPTYSTGNHYIVAYKASSPSDLAGSSDINLTGA
jgi:hypothetical protein